MKRFAILCSLVLAGCSKPSSIAIDYTIPSTIDLASISLMETNVAIANQEAFTADVDFRTVATGIGYEVRDFAGTGTRTLRITHDATLGFVFSSSFTFTLIPPIGDVPPLAIDAIAYGASTSIVVGKSAVVNATFGSGSHAQVTLATTSCGGKTCAVGQSCCGGRCIDTTSDAMNCGGCGMTCDAATGGTCVKGSCSCAGGSACTGSQQCCDTNGCIDVSSDVLNCGSCGHPCAAGLACIGGECSCGAKGVTCDAGSTCCNGTSCKAQGETCTCGSTTCATGQACCNDTCVDTTTSDTNCGSCGAACTIGHCSAGSCRCSASSAACGSNANACCGNACVNTMVNPNNCGMCGNACDSQSSCQKGTCVCGGKGSGGAQVCKSSEGCCSSNDGSDSPSCVNLLSADHCGACGTKCGANETCSSSDGSAATAKCTCGNINGCGSTGTCCVTNGNGFCSPSQVGCGPSSSP